MITERMYRTMLSLKNMELGMSETGHLVKLWSFTDEFGNIHNTETPEIGSESDARAILAAAGID